MPELPDVEVYVDGGIRHGTDVLKCLALGARAAFVGRAALWGLIVSGEDGLLDVLTLLREQLDQAMRFCGITHVGDVSSDVVLPVSQFPRPCKRP